MDRDRDSCSYSFRDRDRDRVRGRGRGGIDIYGGYFLRLHTLVSVVGLARWLSSVIVNHKTGRILIRVRVRVRVRDRTIV